ncbi:MAG: ABC transporter ATP-binding protein [Leucobacter sp.]|nr:ABC transporter ATP-binding protein [Leucobacter sp.]
MGETAAAPQAVVEVRELTVTIASGREIVSDVSFSIAPGEVLGLVGQSGSGKTTVGMALLGYERHGARMAGGSIVVDGIDVRALDDAGRRALRGRNVAYVPQDPRASLNPAMSIGDQIGEVLEIIGFGASHGERQEAVREALEDVGLPMTDEFLKRFPHQLSGGQLQRVGIAMAIVGKPPVLVLDEPTTGLDVTTQDRVLRLVRRLCTEHGIAGLYVTHDLAVVAEIADRVLVMNLGRTVEEGGVDELFRHPRETYTQRLLAAAPDIADPPRVRALDDPGDEGVLRVSGLAAGYHRNQVLHDVSFELQAGECLAVVGESGSGKSTLSRALIGLHPQHTGDVRWRGKSLPRRAERRSRAMVRDLQYIFQSPFTALNPRATIGDSILFAHKLTRRGASSAERHEAVLDALERVGLDRSAAELLPNRLSGGERQRVAIARALVTKPKVLICDEITSALDVIVQAQIVDLLGELQEQEGLSMLFVTHNLALVKSFADRVLVLNKGRVVETGETGAVLSDPQDAYTKSLMRHTPSISLALEERERGVRDASRG